MWCSCVGNGAIVAGCDVAVELSDHVVICAEFIMEGGVDLGAVVLGIVFDVAVSEVKVTEVRKVPEL